MQKPTPGQAQQVEQAVPATKPEQDRHSSSASVWLILLAGILLGIINSMIYAAVRNDFELIFDAAFGLNHLKPS